VRKSFPGYYRPSETEFADLWRDCVFVFDANVPLNIYGYSPQTRDSILSLLETVAVRLWMPHQFASEYQRNRVGAIVEQVNHYRTVTKSLEDILKTHFQVQHRHPHIKRSSLRSFEKLCVEISSGQAEHEALLKDDPYYAKLTGLLDGRVGEAYSEERLALAFEEARKRYAKGVPPGFMDFGKKPEPDCFGDYVGWRQILEFSKEAKRPIIFVTDDLKADWWYTHSERRIGPRAELVAEFWNDCGQAFYMYTLERYMHRAEEYLGQTIEKTALDEVRERSEARTASESDPKKSGADTKTEEKSLAPGDVPKAQSPPANGEPEVSKLELERK
jgi:hypothetical protein